MISSQNEHEQRKIQIITAVKALMEEEKSQSGHHGFELSTPTFKIEEYPEILDRLASLGSHFEDSIYMARMIFVLWEKFAQQFKLQDKDRSQMMICALLHDIGKSGPMHVKPELKGVISRLFATPQKRISLKTVKDGKEKSKTVSEFMD